MKLSKFNSIIPIGESKYILFNAYTDKFLFFGKELHKQFPYKEQNININEIDEDFYDKLCEAGALVDDEEDEIQKVKELSNNAIHNLHEFHLMSILLYHAILIVGIVMKLMIRNP